MSSIEKAAERLQVQQKAPDDPDQAPSRAEQPAQPKAESPDSNGVHVDFERLQDEGILTPMKAQGLEAEEYRLLKRPLLMNAFGKGAAIVENGNLVVVTSALPGEGKTFTTINLAMSMAMERDTTVLLVDSDVIKPSLSKMLGLSNYPGLTDVLADEQVDLGDLILRTDVPKLRILPAGRSHAHSTELLASAAMSELAEELSRRYPDRIVLFDAPPLLATSQAHVLADIAGQILMVVEAGRTPQHAVQDAISKLDQDKVVGLTLNKTRQSRGGDYYYGGYYGAYGQ